MKEIVANNDIVIILENRRNLFSLVFKWRKEVIIPTIAKMKLRYIKGFPIDICELVKLARIFIFVSNIWNLGSSLKNLKNKR